MANTTIYPYGTNGQLPSSIGVINDLTTGGADKALSAEMGKRLRKAIASLLNALSPTAFTGEKPTDTYLDIDAPKFTITLPNDTRVDMTDQSTQVEAGDSYTNTFSLNETAEEGYVLRLSATMEGGGEISADSTTGVVSTNNVTGNITITASAGVPPMKVHSFEYSPSYDGDNKRYLNDSVGDFRLYNKADANLPAAYPSGSYGNVRSGKDETGATGYGTHRTLSAMESGTDFTVKVRHLVVVPSSSNPSSAYNAYQSKVQLYQSAALKWKKGQFQLILVASNGATSHSEMALQLGYGTGSAEKYALFNDITTLVSSQNTYDYLLSFVASTQTATVYRVTLETGTVEKCGEKVVDEVLNCNMIAYVPSQNLNGLDIYNYAMSQSDIEDEYSNSN